MNPIKRRNELSTLGRSKSYRSKRFSLSWNSKRSLLRIAGSRYFQLVFQRQVPLAYIEFAAAALSSVCFGSYVDERGKARTKRYEAYFWTRIISFHSEGDRLSKSTFTYCGSSHFLKRFASRLYLACSILRRHAALTLQIWPIVCGFCEGPGNGNRELNSRSLSGRIIRTRELTETPRKAERKGAEKRVGGNIKLTILIT